VTAQTATLIDPVPVTPVDTTGAGDAFIGAFARVFAENGDVPAALRVAARYAADSITKRGAQAAYATAEEFAAFLTQVGE
jgi:ribokinase